MRVWEEFIRQHYPCNFEKKYFLDHQTQSAQVKFSHHPHVYQYFLSK
jgi:hypothetical protein